mmetsp:Transcript_62498/g.182702  ORF Transcript_62498/g.182702 Transcript_62498/m.182702 type:complete len:215 (+) Transcript_62498:416-1060(+)
MLSCLPFSSKPGASKMFTGTRSSPPLALACSCATRPRVVPTDAQPRPAAAPAPPAPVAAQAGSTRSEETSSPRLPCSSLASGLPGSSQLAATPSTKPAPRAGPGLPGPSSLFLFARGQPARRRPRPCSTSASQALGPALALPQTSATSSTRLPCSAGQGGSCRNFAVSGAGTADGACPATAAGRSCAANAESPSVTSRCRPSASQERPQGEAEG